MSNDMAVFEALGGTAVYRHVGGNSGCPATATVIIGGAFANVFSFQVIERELQALGPVFILDLASWSPTDAALPHTQRGMLDFVAAFVDAVAGAGVDLIGICNGGTIAYAYAAQRPDRVRSLVLGSTALDPGAEAAAALRRICANLDRGDRAALAANVLDLLMGDDIHPAVERGERTRNLLRRMLLETSAEDMRRMARSLRLSLDRWPDFPRSVTGVRALAYTGEFDRYTRPADCWRMAQTVDGCEFYTVRQADHMVHIERPQALAAVFRDFIARSGPVDGRHATPFSPAAQQRDRVAGCVS